NDTLAILGDFGSSVIRIQQATSVEDIIFRGHGPNGHPATNNFAVAMGNERLNVDARDFGGNFSFTWGTDTLAEEQTAYRFAAGFGNFRVERRNQNDLFYSTNSRAVVTGIGNGGDDTFVLSRFNASDQLDGGSGFDVLGF